MKKSTCRALVPYVFTGTLFTASSAMAAVDAAITTAISTMAADAATVASAVLVAIIGVVAIKFIRKGL